MFKKYVLYISLLTASQPTDANNAAIKNANVPNVSDVIRTPY